MKRIRFRVDDDLYNKMKQNDLDNADIVRRMYRKIHKKKVNINKIIKPKNLKHIISVNIEDKYSYISRDIVRTGLIMEFEKEVIEPVPLKIDADELNAAYFVVDEQ